MTSEALRVENVDKFFPPALSGWQAWLNPLAKAKVAALRDVSFSIAPGEVVGLVGANGAGKSTLLRILTTLLVPTRGRAYINAFDVARNPAEARQQLGFHGGSDASFYARLSARENLRLFAALNNISRVEADRRITELIDLLHLGEFMDRQLRTFSTGTVHRLGLARALLHRPSVLLLDEPTRSLDPLAAAEFRRFLLNDIVRRRGTTLLFASHTLAEVEQLAGRVALLHTGRLLAYETPKHLLGTSGASTLEQSIAMLVEQTSSPS